MTPLPLFRVRDEVFERFPAYIVACVVARGIDVEAASERLDELVDLAITRARATFGGQDLKAQPPFAAWREAFSTAGWSASRFPASVEALHKRVQRGDSLPRINTPVDLANSAVLNYAVPVGTHDLATFGDQPLEVRLSTPDDRFVAMDGSPETVEDGEIVYAVGHDIRTRRWVWRQGRNGRVAAAARDIFFPLDGFGDKTYDALVAAQNYLARICAEDFGADVATGLVKDDCPEFSGSKSL